MSGPLTKSANQFAVDLFQCYLRRHGDKYKNLLLCPYLIYHSLAMMLVGAKGTTAEQLVKLLRLPLPPKQQQQPQRKSQRPPSTTASSLAFPFASQSSKKSKSNTSLSSAGGGAARNEQPPPQTGSSTGLGHSTNLSMATLSVASSIGHKEFLLLTEQLLHGNHEFVHLASFLYLDKATKRTENYKTILRDYYETKPKKIDFNNAEQMVKTVNEDVARTTENIYNDILSKQEAQQMEKCYMLLVNAVFFRGFWLSNFTDVKKSPFYKFSPGQQQSQFSVNMMSKLDYLPVALDQQLDARIIRMQFEASDLQMLIVLPNNKQSDSTYLTNLISANKIHQIMEEFSTKAKCKTVRISMPIFCIDSGKISIQSTLVTMGASDLFDKDKANMSGACENKQIWLHKILHRCFIICDNRGAITSSSSEKARQRQAKAEASLAAATAASSQIATSGRLGVDEFVADHPFMYIIIDAVTRTILLMGLYTDPSETLEVIHENQLSPEEAHQIYTEGVYKT